MIIKTYRCDLCNEDVKFPDGGFFLKWDGLNINLVPLTQDKGVSGKLICRTCCTAMTAALEKLNQPFA